MNTLWLDIETRSAVNIHRCGGYKYLEDPSTEVILLGYALNEDPVEVIDLYRYDLAVWRDFRDRWAFADVIAAHNSQFERVAFNIHFPFLKANEKRWHDTMIKAYLHALPGSLGSLSEIFKLGEDEGKMKEGRELMLFFCAPIKNKTGKIEFRKPEDFPEKWEKFKEYNRLDVVAERAIDKKMPAWNMTEAEMSYWAMDRRLNDRGFRVDIDLAEKAIAALAKAKVERDAETQDITLGRVESATQRDAVLRAILDIYGVSLPDMQKSTIERRLEDPELPEEVKELLKLRLMSASTCGAKYQVLLDAVCQDGALHGTIQFGGAWRTMRDGGRMFQPQNLPRPPFKADIAEMCVSSLKEGWYPLMHDDTVKIATAALRGSIIAREGKKLVIVDLSSIEGRVLAWLAGEQWELDAYVDYDLGIGPDIYKLTYAKTFGIKVEDVSKDQRQMGKVLRLALGYGGGVGSFLTFSKTYNVNLERAFSTTRFAEWAWSKASDYFLYCKEKNKSRYGLSDDTFIACDAIKRMWRMANKSIMQFWWDLETAFKSAIEDANGRRYPAGKVSFSKSGNWVRLHLPSGRCINYPSPRIDKGGITYLGQHVYTHQWGRQQTNGGKLAGNSTQADSRDVFKHGCLLAEKAGYEPILFVHDENVTEVPDTPKYNVDGLRKFLCTVPKDHPGLPLNAAGFEAYRYGKDD